MLATILRRPIAVTMCIVALCVMGVLSLRYVPVSLMPEIDIPQITIHASMPGYSAQEVERNVVSPLRGRLMQVAGATGVSTEARMDAGTIRMTFEPGSNVNLLFIEVNEKIDRAMSQMPKDMERPKVMKASAMDIPAFFLDVTPSSPTKFAQLSKFARNVITKRIEQLPQVAMVDVSGTVGTEIDVIPDVEKIQAMGLTVSDIESVIRQNDITFEALSIVDGLYRYNVHFDSQLLTKKDIESIYINHRGRLLQLKDICNVEEHTAAKNGLVRHDGEECITMAIIKQSDAQMDELLLNMDKLLTDMRKEYPDIKFQLTRDQTRLLNYTIESLKDNLYIGALMASIVLLVFMRNWKLSLLVTLSIPLSLVITTLCFYLMGISMNIISLSGLILGVGMMVDNAIIVVDNLSETKRRHKREGTDILMTSSRVKEVFSPMLSSVLTTCSVFIPLIFLSGTAGALFYDQAMGISIALFASLLVATVVVPVYYLVLHKKDSKTTKRQDDERSVWRTMFPRLYEVSMKWTLRHAKLLIVLFIMCIPLLSLLVMNLEKQRMPKVEQDDTLLTIDWNSNISSEENDSRMRTIMNVVRDYVETSTCMIGTQEFMLAHTKDITSSETVAYLKSHSSKDVNLMKTAITDYLRKHYPRAGAEFSEPGNLYDLIFSTDKADLEIHLQDKEGKRPSVKESRAFRDTLLKRFPTLDVSPVMTETNIEYAVDMQQMAVYKVSYDDLYRRLKELVNRGGLC